MTDILTRIDAAVEGRCSGPGCDTVLTDAHASAHFCTPDCQARWSEDRADRPNEVRGSHHVAPDQMRWRPDLVTVFDDSDLELTDEISDCGLLDQLVGTARTRRWYRHSDGRRFLRLDDGNRFVGVFVPSDERPESEVWARLERELTDPRRLADEQGPDRADWGQAMQALMDGVRRALETQEGDAAVLAGDVDPRVEGTAFRSGGIVQAPATAESGRSWPNWVDETHLFAQGARERELRVHIDTTAFEAAASEVARLGVEMVKLYRSLPWWVRASCRVLAALRRLGTWARRRRS